MLNIGGGELLVIMLVALIVLGPAKLPEAARQVGKVASELRRMSSSFQNELRSAMDEPTEKDARERGAKVISSEQDPAPGSSEPEISTAEAAGMYDVPAPAETEPQEHVDNDAHEGDQ
jgi:sec-independent protein translocase protein TatB